MAMTDEGCTLTEVLIPDQSLISPAQELTTSGSSVSHDQPTLNIVNSDGDPATAVAATGSSQNFYLLESPPDHVAIQMDHDHDPLQTGAQTIATINHKRTTTSTTGRAGHRQVTSGIGIAGTSSSLPSTNSIYLGLAFQAAAALMTFRFQLQGGNSFPLYMVCGCILTLIGMLLRRVNPTAANISGYAGVLSVGLGFFLMMEMFVPEQFRWSVWIVAGILLLAFAYSIVKRS